MHGIYIAAYCHAACSSSKNFCLPLSLLDLSGQGLAASLKWKSAENQFNEDRRDLSCTVFIMKEARRRKLIFTPLAIKPHGDED